MEELQLADDDIDWPIEYGMNAHRSRVPIVINKALVANSFFRISFVLPTQLSMLLFNKHLFVGKCSWLVTEKKCILYISKHWEMFIINVTLLLLPNAENNLGIKKFIQKAEIIENIKKIVSSLICRFSYFLKDMLWNNRLFISCVF